MCLASAHRSRLERIPLTASSSWSFKNRFKKKCFSVFPSMLQARKSHPARPPSTQMPPPLCCCQRDLYNLKKSPCVAQGVCPGQVGDGAFRKKAGDSLARQLPAPAGSSRGRN